MNCYVIIQLTLIENLRVYIRRGIEVVITGLTRNQFESNLTRVRIPPSAPKQKTIQSDGFLFCCEGIRRAEEKQSVRLFFLPQGSRRSAEEAWNAVCSREACGESLPLRQNKNSIHQPQGESQNGAIGAPCQGQKKVNPNLSVGLNKTLPRSHKAI